MASDATPLNPKDPDRRRALALGAGGLAAGAATLAAGTAAAQTVPTSSPLAGKVALVTGAGREIGIGRAVAVALAREGADVVICDINRDIDTIPYPLSTPEQMAETKRLIEVEGRSCIARTLDTRDLPALRTLVADAVKQFGGLDIVVPNAGVLSRAKITEMTDAQWLTIIDVNINGTMNTIRATAPELRKRGQGNIVIIGSVAGRIGSSDTSSHYFTTKWGLIGLAKSAAIEFAPDNIKVNVVAPGVTRTGMIINDTIFREFVPGVENPTEEQVKAALLRDAATNAFLPVPWVTPENIAETVLFLAKDTGRFVSGAQFEVSHGMNAHHTA